jgi:hypothetical protein
MGSSNGLAAKTARTKKLTGAICGQITPVSEFAAKRTVVQGQSRQPDEKGLTKSDGTELAI